MNEIPGFTQPDKPVGDVPGEPTVNVGNFGHVFWDGENPSVVDLDDPNTNLSRATNGNTRTWVEIRRSVPSISLNIYQGEPFPDLPERLRLEKGTFNESWSIETGSNPTQEQSDEGYLRFYENGGIEISSMPAWVHVACEKLLEHFRAKEVRYHWQIEEGCINFQIVQAERTARASDANDLMREAMSVIESVEKN